MWHLGTLHSDGLDAWNPVSKKKLKRIENLKRKTDHELLDYVYSIIKGLPIFEKIPSTVSFNKKSNEEADKYRKMGNDLFIGSFDFFNSVSYYTRAVALAEPGSENFSFAYSNRSHVLFDHGYFIQCLEDIERALKCKHSDNLKQKLLLRRNMAEQRKRYQRSLRYHDSLPEIKNKNKSIEVASNAVTIRVDETLGRHIIAAKNIKIGDILAVEAPYANVVAPAMQNFHCDECLELCFNMIACENCTAALYCSERCREQAYKLYHKYECILIHCGLNIKTVFLRITLKALLEYDQLVKDLARTDDNVFRVNRYKEIYQLETRKNLQNPLQLFQNALEPVVFYHYLTTYTNILQDLQNIENKEQVLKHLLLRNYLVTVSNRLSVEKIKQDYICIAEFDTVGNGIYAFYSLFKHSCYSNTSPFYYGNTIVIRALANIKKGEQLTTSFGLLFSTTPKQERQSSLLKRYDYVCRCIPCVNNWPPAEQLREGAPIPKKFAKKVIKLLKGQTVDMDYVHKLLTEAYTLYDNMKPTEVPTENYLFFRSIVSDLFFCFGNRIIE